MKMKRIETLKTVLNGGGGKGYNAYLYRDPEGRYLWTSWSYPEVTGEEWRGYQDVPLEAEYFASEEVYTDKMFEREISEEMLNADIHCTRMLVVTPEYLSRAVLECLLAGWSIDIGDHYYDQFTFDLTPRMEVLKTHYRELYEAAVAELIAEKERVDGRGDTLTAEQIRAYLERRPYIDTPPPPYVCRHHGRRDGQQP